MQSKKSLYLKGLISLALPIVLGFAWMRVPSSSPQSEPVSPSSQKYGPLPLSFERNQGQSAPQAKFLSRGDGGIWFFTPEAAILKLQTEKAKASAVTMKFVGAAASPSLQGEDLLAGRSNYFIGKDPQKWLRNVPLFSKLWYRSLYPGIDLVFYGNPTRLEFDFRVSPGAKPENIRLAYTGAKNIEIDREGNLVLQLDSGAKLIHHKPVTYQEIEGQRQSVDSSYVLQGEGEVAFRVAAYDKNRPLVIDPVLSYSTYLGGSALDKVGAIAVDAQGHAYVTGSTTSADFPTTPGAFDVTLNNAEVFITKLNPAGTALIYSTFLGGSLPSDIPGGIAVDTQGNAYVTGHTSSNDFPTTPGVVDTVFNGPEGDIFVTKLDPSGTNLIYSTYLGGTENPGGFEDGTGIAIDTSGNAYVVGLTAAPDFPLLGTLPGQITLKGAQDAFITKLNPTATALVYSSYLGGSANDGAVAVAVDPQDKPIIVGTTSSMDFPQINPFQLSYGGGVSDTFVVKINADGNGYIYSTYLGGNNSDVAFDVATDVTGSAYLTGQTVSMNFPTSPGAFDTTCGENTFSSAYVAKFDLAGARVYSTCLGGTDGLQHGRGIAVDSNFNAYVGGYTTANNFPTTPGALDTACGTTTPCSALLNKYDLFLAKLNPSASALLYSTYLGGDGEDVMIKGKMLALDSSRSAYLMGEVSSTDFPTTPGAFDTTYNGGDNDVVVAKISMGVLVTKSASADSVTTGSPLTYTLTVTNNGIEEVTQVTLTDPLPAGVAFVSAEPAGCSHASGTVTCNLGSLALGASTTVTIAVTAPTTAGTITNTATVRTNESTSESPASVETTVTSNGNGNGNGNNTGNGGSCSLRQN